MAGQTYQVNYIVNVDANNALSALRSFKQTVASMRKATRPLMDMQRQLRGLADTMSPFNRGMSIKIETRPATQKIGKLIRGLQMAQAEVQKLNAMGVNFAATKGKSSSSKSSKQATATATSVASKAKTATAKTVPRTTPVANNPSKAYARLASKGPSNLAYKIWGPTPLPSNGGMAIDMLKGMGIAYGIAGLGSMVSNIVSQATEYDNVMKTVENILKSHDTAADFGTRFSAMTNTVRNVGMETKFKVTEVADAAKFLAMAGLNVEAISQSIRPIADIALVGDTELGQTADLVTNIMTAYNIAPAKMRNAADVMTNTFTMSNTTLTEIAEAYKYAASLLSAGKVPFEEATAAIGVLGDAGIKGSQAGTTLRTIMANVVNPTKKQREAWDAIGVSRFNSDGSRKSLLEIFKSLNNANLGVDSYYKLFHKTAASGAVALASHVSKWEDIYLENYLANGLSAQLADEKKNTLQGLWAQLESVFVDKGVTAFSGVQGQLRSMMTSAIEWLKSDEATEAFKKVSKTIMEFVDLIIQASKIFAKLYDTFGWFIKAWMKFQLMIWPVTKSVGALVGIFNALLGVRKVGLWINWLASNFKGLGNAAALAGRSMAGTTAVANATAGGNLTLAPSAGLFALHGRQLNWVHDGVVIGNPKKSFLGTPLGFRVNKPLRSHVIPDMDEQTKAIYTRHPKYEKLITKYQKHLNRRIRIQQGISMTGGLAGSAGLGYGLYKLTDDNNNWADQTAGGLYSVAGLAAMTGHPIGLGIGIALGALGGLFQAIGSANKSTEIVNQIQDWAKQNSIKNGVISNSESQIMQYLEAQYTTYSNINDLINKRIELTSKLLGLQSGENPMDASTGAYQHLMDWNKDLWKGDSIDAFNAVYKDKFNTNLHLVKSSDDGQYYLTTADGVKIDRTQQVGGYGFKITGANGEEALRVASPEAAFASMAATAEVMAPGGYYEKLVEGLRTNVAKFAMKGALASDVDKYIEQVSNANNPANLTNLIPLSDIKDTDWNLERMLRDMQTRIYMWEQLQKVIAPMQEAYHSFREEMESGDLSGGTLSNYLRLVLGGQAGLAIKDYDPNNVAGWFANNGFKNGKWDYLVQKDENGIVTAYTAQEAAKMAASNMQSVIDAIKQSGAAAEPAAIALMNHCYALLTQAQAAMSASDELIDVAQNQEITLNGQLYRWNELKNLYEAIDSDGNLMYIQTQMSGLGTSVNTLAQYLGVDWNQAFGGLSNSILGTFNFLNLLGKVKWGDSFMPMPNGSWLGGDNNVGPNTAFGVGLGQYGLGIKGDFGFGENSGFGGWGTNFFQSAWNKAQASLVPNTLTLQDASNAVFNGGGKAIGWKGAGGNTDTSDPSNPDKSGSGKGTKSSDYKSKQKNHAIPKQININIGSLMKVDSIDMTNENNVAVIENLKREIAYALYEAAADGTTMLNNLTA